LHRYLSRSNQPFGCGLGWKGLLLPQDVSCLGFDHRMGD
jgi:hypothetical protein